MRANLFVVLLAAAVGAGCGGVTASNDGGGATGGSAAGAGGMTGGAGGTTGAGGMAGGAGGTGGAAAPTVEQACSQFAEAFCTRLTGCAPFVGQILYGDKATCVTRTALGCMRDLQVPDTNQTTTDMVACARDASNAVCDDLLANVLPASCAIKPGPRLNGEGCGSPWQCQSTHCEKPGGDCGVCAPRAAANGACTADEGCMPGLVCAAQKCVMPGQLNAACNAANPCRGNLYCNAKTNMCAMPVGVGGSCDGDNNACDGKNGVGCNVFASPQRCETVAAAKGGQACGIVNNTLTLCIVNNSCNGVSLVPLSTMGTCPSPAGDGQQCSDKVHCMAPANCVGGLCRLSGAASCTR